MQISINFEKKKEYGMSQRAWATCGLAKKMYEDGQNHATLKDSNSSWQIGPQQDMFSPDGALRL